MARPSPKAFDRLQQRYEPAGLLTSLEDRRTALLIVLAVTVFPPLVTVPFIALFAVTGEDVMLAVAIVMELTLLAGLAHFLTTGSQRTVGLVYAWAVVVLGVTGHLVLGGFQWSGGYLWWGIGGVLPATLFLGPRDAIRLGTTLLVAAAVYLPLEGWLQGLREQPDPLIAYVMIVSIGTYLMVVVGAAALFLGGRIRSEQARNRQLMLNILPATIADRLKAEPGMIADRFDGCTILFADLVGFTAHAKGKDPEQIVGELNTIFSRFDALAAEHRAEKIKTIGDGYMAATGLPDPDPDHLRHACDLALAMVDAMPALNAELGTGFQLRVGVNTGSAVAGVVGTSKFSYDVWGDTVNLASRLEANGTPGAVAVSEGVARALDGHYAVQAVGTKDLKGQGPTEIFRLIDRLPSAAQRTVP